MQHNDFEKKWPNFGGGNFKGLVTLLLKKHRFSKLLVYNKLVIFLFFPQMPVSLTFLSLT